LAQVHSTSAGTGVKWKLIDFWLTWMYRNQWKLIWISGYVQGLPKIFGDQFALFWPLQNVDAQMPASGRANSTTGKDRFCALSGGESHSKVPKNSD
jgi:hypothetical protein